MRQNKDYIPEIEGIRAISILSVVLFHFSVPGFSGGFSGVDVFFVISGFLITRIIKDKMEAGTFSFTSFYVKRARRLLPALFVIYYFCFIFSFFLLSPQHFSNFCGSLISSITYISNFFFLGESGYFDSSADVKPLLHTWSLSIEEQFYLIWPFCLYLLNKKVNKRSYIALLFIFLSISLSASIYLGRDSENLSKIFYLTPLRFFEFLIGILLVEAKKIKINWILEVCLIAGLSLVVAPVFLFDSKTIFPSYNALIPCLGTALIIYGHNAKFAARILNNQIATFFGRISYSWYLCHWPIYVFYKYFFDRDLTNFDSFILIFLTIGPAYLLHRFVEERFRFTDKKESFNPSIFYLAFTTQSLIVVSITSHGWANNGWPWRVSWGKETQTIFNTKELTKTEWENYRPIDQLYISNIAFHNYVWYEFLKMELPFFDHGKKNILLVGDSMAGDFANVLLEAKLIDLEKSEFRSHVIRFSCRAFIDVHDYRQMYKNDAEKCKLEHRQFRGSVNLKHADVVILASQWDIGTISELKNTIKFLVKQNKKVIVVGKKILNAEGLTVYAKHSKNISDASLKLSGESFLINSQIAKIDADFLFINIADYFCKGDDCKVANDNGYVYVYDSTHLTPKGAETIGNKLKNKNIGKSFFACN